MPGFIMPKFINDRVSVKELRQALAYCPETGHLTWIRGSRRRAKGTRAGGWVKSQGYRVIRVGNVRVQEHRAIWAHFHGYWPRNPIDHANGVRDDNRIVNLREATCEENIRNRGPSKRNACGLKGVSWNKRDKKWVVFLKHKGVSYDLGRHESKEVAYKAYCDKAHELHGKFVWSGLLPPTKIISP